MTLRKEHRGPFALWTIDRPETKNALNAATFEALRAAIDEAAGDEALRAIVLTGEGDTFVSGGDLRELRHATTEADAQRLAEAGRSVTAGLSRLSVPVIAALGGPAIGGGAELALACDLRVAARSARLCFRHARMGVTTAWGTLPRLFSMVGPGVAGRLLYTAQELSAEDALGLRLVDAVVDDGTAVDHALAWAEEIGRSAPTAVAHFKALLAEAQVNPGGLWESERRRFVRSWVSPDHVEAIAAFFDRRPPTWR